MLALNAQSLECHTATALIHHHRRHKPKPSPPTAVCTCTILCSVTSCPVCASYPDLVQSLRRIAYDGRGLEHTATTVTASPAAHCATACRLYCKTRAARPFAYKFVNPAVETVRWSLVSGPKCRPGRRPTWRKWSTSGQNNLGSGTTTSPASVATPAVE